MTSQQRWYWGLE